MKKYGVIISVVGIIVTAFAGFQFVTRKKVVDMGSLEMMANEHHTLGWSPYWGVGIIAIGLIVYFVGSKSKQL